MSSDKNEIETIAELVRDGSEMDTHTFENGQPDFTYMVMNQNSKVFDLDKYLPAPRRTVRDFEVKSIDSFIDYVNRYKKEHTSIFAKPLVMRDGDHGDTIAQAYIDYHGKDEAGWCSHQISLGYETSPEWRVWAQSNTRRMAQRAMINFIKDNAAQILEPDVGELVQEMTKLTVNSSGKLVVTEKSLGSARAQEREVTVNAILPEIMKIQLKPLMGGGNYVLKCRFNVMPDLDEGEVSFSYNIINRDETIADIYADYCTQMSAIEGVKLYK